MSTVQTFRLLLILQARRLRHQMLPYDSVLVESSGKPSEE